MNVNSASNTKNQYLWGLMKVVKNNRPYYAKWWFFISLIALGWITPITKHWDLFIFGESTTAFPMKRYGSSLLKYHKFAFKVDQYHYVSSYSLEHWREAPEGGITIFYDANNPEDHIPLKLDKMYSDEHLFFPVGLQIGLAVFFLLQRFKEL